MITVEFFSIPKRRAGVNQLEVQVDGPVLLTELLAQVAQAIPEFGECCLDQSGQLQKHYLAMLDSERLHPDCTTLIPSDSCVLILSADVGG
jgi:hypothetical protein